MMNFLLYGVDLSVYEIKIVIWLLIEHNITAVHKTSSMSGTNY